ncbi:MAG TPA: 6,7-dimethyl-8-ribityllumazine synthase [Candidatus Binatia bacterium]|nr:6,7-dimethyl-8-ribityllumazine synthase [Candidatus Binatia bacterium]
MSKTGYTAPAAPGRGEFSRARIALVATRWNADIVEALLAGARRGLQAWGVAARAVTELYAPGAYELPLACELAARSRRYDGVVALGAVIRGDTPHFDFVAGECARGLQDVALRHRLPVGFGVLTVHDARQARDRAGPGPDNKGVEAAQAVLEMLRLKRALR